MQLYVKLLADEARRVRPFDTQIDADFIRDLECCAPLHDVGTVALPDHILHKPGRLDAEERMLMQSHTQLGAELLEKVLDKYGSRRAVPDNGGRPGPAPPRALGRRRLSRQAGRRIDPAGGPAVQPLRRVRRLAEPAGAPPGPGPRGGGAGDRRRVRRPIRPAAAGSVQAGRRRNSKRCIGSIRISIAFCTLTRPLDHDNTAAHRGAAMSRLLAAIRTLYVCRSDSGRCRFRLVEAAQRHARPHRRPGLRRSRLPRQSSPPDAEHRPIRGQAVECTHFYVCPVCSPTRASLMTGRYNYRTGVVDTFAGRSLMRPDEVTLAAAAWRRPAIARPYSANGTSATTIRCGRRIAAFRKC